MRGPRIIVLDLHLTCPESHHCSCLQVMSRLNDAGISSTPGLSASPASAQSASHQATSNVSPLQQHSRTPDIPRPPQRATPLSDLLRSGSATPQQQGGASATSTTQAHQPVATGDSGQLAHQPEAQSSTTTDAACSDTDAQPQALQQPHSTEVTGAEACSRAVAPSPSPEPDNSNKLSDKDAPVQQEAHPAASPVSGQQSNCCSHPVELDGAPTPDQLHSSPPDVTSRRQAALSDQGSAAPTPGESTLVHAASTRGTPEAVPENVRESIATKSATVQPTGPDESTHTFTAGSQPATMLAEQLPASSRTVSEAIAHEERASSDDQQAAHTPMAPGPEQAEHGLPGRPDLTAVPSESGRPDSIQVLS